MAHTSDKITLTARREALAELAHVLMIDYLRRWNGATKANIRLAKKHLDEVRKIGEPGALAHVVQGQIHEVEGNLKLAIGEWNKALEIDPKLAIAYAHKANAMILQGDAAAALPLVEDALKARDPDSGLLYWFKGRAHFNLGHDNEAEYDKAIECLKKSVHERPTTWFSWAHLISAYALTGRPKTDPDVIKAIDTYKREFRGKWPLNAVKDYYKQRNININRMNSRTLLQNTSMA